MKRDSELRIMSLPRLRVSALAGCRTRGKVLAGTSVIPCSLGPGGVSFSKREGDGKTPAGSYALLRVLVRRDRMSRPNTDLPQGMIRPNDGWSDDPASPLYNRPVRLPWPGRHEHLWRSDRLYDLVVVVGYNMGPILKNKGSAIFLHVEAPARTATAGCVAIPPSTLRRLLSRIGPHTRFVIA